MIVVSDSTPLITLMKATQLRILHELFGEIIIPEAVHDELTINEKYIEEAKLINSSEFIRVISARCNSCVHASAAARNDFA